MRWAVYYEPTILTDVTHEMSVMRDETFGPLLPIMRVPDEAAALLLCERLALRIERERVDPEQAQRCAEMARAIESGCVGRERLHGHLRRPRGALRRRQGERDRPSQRRDGSAGLLPLRSRS